MCQCVAFHTADTKYKKVLKIRMSITLSSAITALIKAWIIGYSYIKISFKKALSNFTMKCRANLSELRHFSLNLMFYLQNSLKNEFASEF